MHVNKLVTHGLEWDVCEACLRCCKGLLVYQICSEVVSHFTCSCALRDNGHRAVLIGDTSTFGKGKVGCPSLDHLIDF